MKPADLRNATWREVLTHLTEDMVRVHLEWQAHGPGTTRAIAQKSGISLLTFRPRTTDLYKLGLVELAGREGNEGIYTARTREEAEAAAAWRTRADFRRSESDRRPQLSTLNSQPEQLTGFATVDQAVASLAPAEQAALGARLMGKWGHLLKRRESPAGQAQLQLLSV